MLYTHCAHEDCRAPIMIPDDEIPKAHGAYSYNCPICRRGVRFGVVSKFTPIRLPGGG